ncbi:inosose isomerase [Klebsiella michiganensis]|uniref:Inosose isomerase n=1 Tax=Klebsiella michiganensis TaxID=1134687 RepID=A0A7H4PJF5_9ENTR|nr:inosose isomerase [Klebsiella michiganensis]
MEIVALNCSGNPLAPGALGEKHTASSYRTVELAAKLGVKKDCHDERSAGRRAGR